MGFVYESVWGDGAGAVAVRFGGVGCCQLLGFDMEGLLLCIYSLPLHCFALGGGADSVYRV